MDELLDKIEKITPTFKDEYDVYLDCNVERFRLGDGIEYTACHEVTIGDYHIIFNGFYDINKDFIDEIIEIKHNDNTKELYGLEEVYKFLNKTVDKP